MPSIDSSVSEINTHIVHPVVEQVTHGILKSIGLDRYFGDNIRILADDTSVQSTHDKNKNPRIRQDRCEVTIEPVFNPTQMKWDALQSMHAFGHGVNPRWINYPIFNDEFHQIHIEEFTVPFYIKLQYSLNITDKNIAYTTLDNLYNRYYNAGISEYKHLLYSYPIPNTFLMILHSLFKLSAFADKMSFKTYIEKGCNNSLDILKNRSGNDSQLVFQKNIYKAIGEMTLDMEKPDGEKKNKILHRDIINFMYDLQLFRPSLLRLNYPSVVNNKPIPSNCIQRKEEYDPLVYETRYDEMTFDAYERHTGKQPLQMRTLHFPEYDDWKIPNTVASNVRNRYHSLFICVFTLDVDDKGNPKKTTTINLVNDFPKEFQFHPIIAEILYLEGKYSILDDALIRVQVYVDDYPLDETLIEFDNKFNLTIHTNKPYKRYHLVISEMLDIALMNSRYIPIVLKYHGFFGLQIFNRLKWLVDMGWAKIEDDTFYISRNVTYGIDKNTADSYKEIDRLQDKTELYDINEYNKRFQGYDPEDTCTWKFNPFDPVTWNIKEYDPEKAWEYPFITEEDIKNHPLYNKNNPLYPFFKRMKLDMQDIIHLKEHMQDFKAMESYKYKGLTFIRKPCELVVDLDFNSYDTNKKQIIKAYDGTPLYPGGGYCGTLIPYRIGHYQITVN